MASALTDIPRKLPSDADAQAVITDFLDYTEFFPSDLFRSLTLIGKLDETYHNDTLKVHEFTKLYASIPKLPPTERPDPQTVRKELSAPLAHAIRCRESSYAEASRLCDVADHLYNRLVTIKKKLQSLPKPPSRDPSPVPKPHSPIANRNRKQPGERIQRITLHTDTRTPSRLHPGSQPRHRTRMTIIPGEVLPPYDPNSPIPSDSESESDRGRTPAPVPVRSMDRDGTAKILKLPKVTTIRIPKPSQRARPHGFVGTNVHSQVAGISVSNAMAFLQPPPPNPKPGTKHAPWLKLTEWELNKLRKRMKKNADWVPSDTMVRRELAENGRGYENRTKAKAHSEATGEEFIDEEPEAFIRPVAYRSQSDNDIDSLENRGMKLNQAKKLKREITLKEQSGGDRGQVSKRRPEQELSIGKDLKHKPAEIVYPEEAPAVGTITVKPRVGVTADNSETASDMLEKAKPPVRSHKKRKRESTPDAIEAVIDPALLVSSEHDSKPTQKKLKLGPPVEVPTVAEDGTGLRIGLVAKDESYGVREDIRSGNSKSITNPSAAVSTEHLEIATSARSSEEVTLAKMKERPVLEIKPPKSSVRASRSGKAATPMFDNGIINEPATARPRSRGSAIISLTLSTKKAASAEPPSRRASGRRGSNASLPSTQASKTKAATSATTARRGRRPAPGVLATTDDNEGGVQVILGKRKAAPGGRKIISLHSASNTNKKQQSKATTATPPTTAVGLDEDEEIDPNEPRYCICGGVSWGTMVACENDACELEWFHLECVGLSEIPGRRTKWYCPDCRIKLKVREHGEPLGRGTGGISSRK